MSRRTQDPSRSACRFRLRGCHTLWPAFPDVFAYPKPLSSMWDVLQPRFIKPVWAVSRSLAATKEIAVAFSSSGYLDVSVPQVCLPTPYEFRCGYCPITDSGFPHSDISGSMRTYSSPKHFGVRPVLHRLLVPRHPPCALKHLTLDK